jgi:hypothetical protein
LSMLDLTGGHLPPVCEDEGVLSLFVFTGGHLLSFFSDKDEAAAELGDAGFAGAGGATGAEGTAGGAGIFSLFDPTGGHLFPVRVGDCVLSLFVFTGAHLLPVFAPTLDSVFSGGAGRSGFTLLGGPGGGGGGDMCNPAGGPGGGGGCPFASTDATGSSSYTGAGYSAQS